MKPLSRPIQLLFALCLLHAFFAHADDVTVYRCTNKNGNVVLRDTLCLPGEEQQVFNMARPQETPPPPTVSTPAPAAPTPEPPAREVVIVRTPAQPMYECTNVETNQRYTSDNGDGNPRLVPVWTGGYPYPAQTWVRDTCHMLPQQEVCARLSDRRYEIIRRYHSALLSERRQLDLEQRNIEARMANDCGSK
jgi:hypothetical protein